MKLKIFYLFILLLLINSCQKDDSSNTSPAVNYKSMEGTWICSENSVINKTSKYSVKITVDDTKNPPEIYIANFYQYGYDYKAILKVLNNSFTIPQQIICSSTVQGSGYINSGLNIIQSTYSVSDMAERDSVYATYTKQ
jgi:hypothetical protein